jgi:hypothetical protein
MKKSLNKIYQITSYKFIFKEIKKIIIIPMIKINKNLQKLNFI